MDISPYLNAPTAIIGTTGSGKSYAAKGAVETLLAEKRRVIIIDPTGAWYGLRSSADGKSDGFPVVIFGGEHADVPIGEGADGKALALAFASREVQAIIDTSEMTGGEKRRFLTPFFENLYAKNKGVLHLIVDEADEIAAQSHAEGDQRMFGAFDKIVRRGRIKGFRPLMITQRPAVINKNVLSQIGTLIALKLTSPQDRKAIEEWVKGNADVDAAKEVVSSLPTLARGEGWVWSPAADVLERTTFPKITTYDSSRTPEVGEDIVLPALSPVDVEDLRSALAVKSDEKTDANVPASVDADLRASLEKAGYEIGYSKAREDYLAKGRVALEEHARYFIRAIDDLSSDLKKVIGALPGIDLSLENIEVTIPSPPEAQAPKKPTAKPSSVMSQNPFYQTAMSIWPARGTWNMLGAMCGRKARGGHFNTNKKALLDGGYLRETGDMVEPVVAPETNGAIPADLLEQNLPQPAQKMFSEIRRSPGHTLASLGQALGMKPTGGHWNTGMSMLKKNGLIVDSSGLHIEPTLEL